MWQYVPLHIYNHLSDYTVITTQTTVVSASHLDLHNSIQIISNYLHVVHHLPRATDQEIFYKELNVYHNHQKNPQSTWLHWIIGRTFRYQLKRLKYPQDNPYVEMNTLHKTHQKVSSGNFPL
jgi:hypothetical protein